MRTLVPRSLKVALFGSAFFASQATAATFTWDGGGADDLFSTAENWAPDGYPFVTGAPGTPAANGHKFVFGPLVPGGQTTVNMNAGGNPDGFEFAAGASAMTIYGTSTMQLATGNLTPILNLSSETQTFSNTVRQFWIGGATTGTHPNLVKNRTWDAAAGDLDYQAILLRPDGINANNTTAIVSTANLVFTGSFDHTVNSTINLEGTWTGKTANLIKNGSGTLLLKGGGNYNGATTINNGIVRIQNNSSLGTGAVAEAQKTDIKSGAALEIDGSLTLTEFIRVTGTGTGGNGAIRAVSGTTNHNSQIALEGTGGVTVSIGVDSGATLKVSRLYSDPNRDTNFEKVGGGTLVLKADNSDDYVGNTTVSAGTLQVGDGGNTGELKTSGVINNAALVFNRANSYTYTGDISGTGTLAQSGAGTLFLGGNSTYSGSTTVTSGTLVVNGSIADTSSVTVGTGGTLGGSGTVGGLTTINGTFGPGNSIDEMTFAAGLILAGISNFEIDPTITLGLNADLATVAGGLTYGGILNLTYGGAPGDFAYGQTFNLFDWSGAGPTGSFSAINLPALDEGLEWQNNLATSGSFTVVPEPSAAALAAFGSFALLRRRRSRG
jgi:autotransporter-associated beta strand protein